MTVLTLPWPPTLNTLYANRKGGRRKTDNYAAWCEEAALALRQQRPSPVVGLYRLTIILERPDHRKRDADNLIKAISDLMKSEGVVSDDSAAQSIFIGWSLGGTVKGGTALVSVEPFSAPQFHLGKAA